MERRRSTARRDVFLLFAAALQLYLHYHLHIMSGLVNFGPGFVWGLSRYFGIGQGNLGPGGGYNWGLPGFNRGLMGPKLSALVARQAAFAACQATLERTWEGKQGRSRATLVFRRVQRARHEERETMFRA